MPSRPPDNDADARVRFFVIASTRIIGAAIVIAGLVGLAGKLPIPDVAAYGFIIFGLFDVFVVPQILARKWRTPDR